MFGGWRPCVRMITTAVLHAGGVWRAQVRCGGKNSRFIKSLPILPDSYAQPCEQILLITFACATLLPNE
jgi:hypothetical protein